VKIVEDHPVTSGVKDFSIFDETYKGMWISDKVKVLATTAEQTSDGPLVWISPFAKSRVVFIQLGHGSEAHRDPNYRQLVRQAIAWAGGR
jgi:type 1 glutamine amidotransferase